MTAGKMRNIARAWEFARHVPVGQLLARAKLTVQRRRAVRQSPALRQYDRDQLTPVKSPPPPVFSPRSGMISRTETGWDFTFLNRRESMGQHIDWGKSGHDAATQLWRMNLHYMEYLEALDAQVGVALIREWIAANPPFQAGFWHDSWNSYTLSLRTLVWMQQRARWGGDVSTADGAAIDQHIASQIAFLMDNLELDIGGNHLIKNIKALAWASAYFEGPVAKAWRHKALDLLKRELPLQILSDGVHYERSPSYHGQVFADLIETRHALGNAAPAELDAALARMAAACALLQQPDGAVAQFNDSGLTMAYPPSECIAAYELVCGGKVPEPHGAFALAESGYFGVHQSTFSLIVDWGRIGPDSLPAHAHGDMGSFELSVAGQRMVVDQGVFEYVAGPLRDASRSAHAHNGCAIIDAEPADFFGAFRCGRRPRDVRATFDVRKDGFRLRGQHDGFAHLPGGPVMERQFDVSAHGFTITDRIVSQQLYAARAGILLHPACTVSTQGQLAKIERDDIVIQIMANMPWAVEPAVWWPDMGFEHATRRLCLTLPADCHEATMTWEIVSPARLEAQ